MNRLEDKINNYLEKQFPDWKHKRGESMQGSKNVLDELWSSSTRVVKVSIVPHKSAAEAKDAIDQFVKYDREREELKGLGDEAFAWGYGLSNVVFSRGTLNVYVSTYADVASDPDANTLTQSEKVEREKSEMKRLSREIAGHVVHAIDLP